MSSSTITMAGIMFPRRLIAFAAFFGVIIVIITIQRWNVPSPTGRHVTHLPAQPEVAIPPKPKSKSRPYVAPEDTLGNDTDWTFDTALHARKHTLTHAQCATTFSDLYMEIDRAHKLRKKIGKVTPADIDLKWKLDAGMRVMIYDQKLYVLEAEIAGSGHDHERGLALLHALDRAILTSPEPLPNIEFSLAVSDVADYGHANHTIWSLTRLAGDKEYWLMPDFGYWSWPLELIGEYDQVRDEIEDIEMPWEDKIPKALWRGALNTNDVRPMLMKATRKKPWADVEEIRWKNRTDLSNKFAGTAIPIADHCKYQFLIQTEGHSYSGRGKYLLTCESITIAHKTEWIEPHQHLLISSGPQQNFVQVERDFLDMERKIKSLLNDHERANQIIKNSVSTFRDKYLTPAAQTCYWRQLMRSWADVSFEPERYELVDGKWRGRGVPFESYVIRSIVNSEKQCSFWMKITFRC